MSERDLPRWAFVLLAVGLPAGLFAIHHDLGHQGDMRFFLEWWERVSGPDPIYGTGSDINYPVLGVLLISAPAWVVRKATGADVEFEAYRTALKVVLVAAETVFVLLLAPLARSLGINRPRLLAIGIWVLPATWAGGAWFGQIDMAGSVWLVAAALGAARLLEAAAGAHREAERDGSTGWKRCAGWSALAGVGLAAAVLTKQLTIFSVPGIAAMWATGLCLLARRRGFRAVILPAASVPVALALVLVPDAFLALPRGCGSHLWMVMSAATSAHGDVLSGNGANLWAIVAADVGASSIDTLYAGVPAKHWGIALFSASQVALAAWLVLEARSILRGSGSAAERSRDIAAMFILAAGMTNLAMATLLTGVHERYLYHGVPLLLLGLAARARNGKVARAVGAAAWVVCGWSGLFVLSSIHWNSFGGWLAPIRFHTVTGLLELGLLAATGLHLGLSRRAAGRRGSTGLA